MNTTKIWTKAQTQATIKALRGAGYEVKKLDSGYSMILDNVELFKAMIGTRGYLVRYDSNLFC